MTSLKLYDIPEWKKKKIEELAKKDPMKLTRQEVAFILEVRHERLFGKEGVEKVKKQYGPDDFYKEADGILLTKEWDPELYELSIRREIEIARGNYTPGKGVFARKYAVPPYVYFPSR